MDRLPACSRCGLRTILGAWRSASGNPLADGLGISHKRARGDHLGPDFKLSPEAQKAILRRYADGEPMALLADEYGFGRATVYRVLDQARAAAIRGPTFGG